MLLPHEEQSSALGTEQPFVPIGRQKIDAIGADINRKNAQPLNRIQKEQAAGPAAHFGDLAKIDSPAGGIADPAYGKDSGSRITSGGEVIEINHASIDWHTANLDAPRRQVHPRIL